MKKITVTITGLAFVLLSFNVQAHGIHNKRFGSYIGFSNGFFYPSYYSSPYYSSYFPSYYPSNSLIAGISFRHRNSWLGLQNRSFNSRISNNRAFNGRYGYNNNFSNERRRINQNYRSGRQGRYNRSCYEVYYDRFGNRIERALPASACRL